MEMRIAKKSRFRIDKLEERVAPVAFAMPARTRLSLGEVYHKPYICRSMRQSGPFLPPSLAASRRGLAYSPVGALLGRRVGPRCGSPDCGGSRRCVERAAPAEEHKQSCGGSRRKGHEDLMTLSPSLQGCATQADPARRGRVGPSWSGRSRAVR